MKAAQKNLKSRAKDRGRFARRPVSAMAAKTKIILADESSYRVDGNRRL